MQAETLDERPAADDAASRAAPALVPLSNRRRNWLVAAVAILAAVAFVGVAAFTVMTARHWTKVDSREHSHYERVATGAFTVTMEHGDVCHVGQLYSDCVDALAESWRDACTGHPLDEQSQALCDGYGDFVDDTRTLATANPYALIASLAGVGNLVTEPITRPKLVIDQHARTHVAVCYLAVFGECF